MNKPWQVEPVQTAEQPNPNMDVNAYYSGRRRVAAYFPNQDQAERAVETLVVHGFNRDQVTVERHHQPISVATGSQTYEDQVLVTVKADDRIVEAAQVLLDSGGDVSDAAGELPAPEPATVSEPSRLQHEWSNGMNFPVVKSIRESYANFLQRYRKPLQEYTVADFQSLVPYAGAALIVLGVVRRTPLSVLLAAMGGGLVYRGLREASMNGHARK